MTRKQNRHPNKSYPIAVFVANARAVKGMTQVDLAEASGLSPGTIASLECGYSQFPKPPTLKGLAIGLSVPYNTLHKISAGFMEDVA